MTNTHENDTELDDAYWEGRAEEANNSSALLAKSNERIVALENELTVERHLRGRADEKAIDLSRKYTEALGKVATLRQVANSAYEIVDVTDEERYFTIGIWPTLPAALTVCRMFADDPDGLNKNGDNEYCRVVVRRRPVGQFSEEGADVAEFVWTSEYDTDDDNWVWRMTETVLGARNE